MDNSVREEAAVEKATINADRDALRELNELQLAFVGGGIADMIGG